MALLDTLQQIAQKSYAAQQPTELRTGTVVSTSPLEITIDTAMAPLRAPVLYLTSSVVEKKITVLKHTHTVDGTETDEALEDIVCTENGTELPTDAQSITLNRALQTGDRVLLLRVQHGQKFIALSRIFEGGAG